MGGLVPADVVVEAGEDGVSNLDGESMVVVGGLLLEVGEVAARGFFEVVDLLPQMIVGLAKESDVVVVVVVVVWPNLYYKLRRLACNMQQTQPLQVSLYS
ncbi:hypothetical protein VNO77_31771 [Canavalia gladiata]|uniref:Uncharacterized protein n=1 Tax=Canavalia gladiata TaxID=3824 RepID=A0AAN9KPY0_CANGL